MKALSHWNDRYREKNYNETLSIYERILALDPANAQVKQTITDLKKVIAAQKNQQ
jgi:hypothetical protein